MMGESPRKPPAIDVEALMEDLRERIAEKKADGLYAVDDLAADLRLEGEPWDPDQLERVHVASGVMPGLVTSPSDGQLLGKAMERVKEQIVRASWRNLADLAEQLNRFHAEITAYATSLGAEVQRMRDEVREIHAGQDGGGLTALNARIERLSASLQPSDVPGGELDLSSLPIADEAPALPPLLAREMDARGGTGLLFGCGTGELLDALGPGWRGVDERGALAAAARARGRDVLAVDPLAYLDGVGADSVDRIVIRELPESRPVGELGRVLARVRHALTSDGVLAIIVRNYTAADERDAFWRDPWRQRPVEPETAAALAVAAGFENTRTLWAGDEESSDGDAARASARCAVVIARPT